MSSSAFTWPSQNGNQAAMSQSRMGMRSASSLTIAVWATCCISLLFFLSGPDFRHWFLVPVTLCGVLIGWDAVAWFRSEVDVLDPVGVLGLLGFHLFFLAPLLHIAWDSWMYAPLPPADWRPWLGGMAILNALGLGIYHWSRSFFQHKFERLCHIRDWKLRRGRFVKLMAIALLITFAVQLSIYARFGGISGYIDTYMTTPEAFEGMGWQLMISESFPILAMIAFAVLARARGWQLNTFHIAVTMLTFCAIQFLFGGLRGSRSTTIWALFWAVGIIHCWLRPIRKSLIYIGLVFLIGFTYAYGFYKETGIKNMDVAQSMELGKKRGRTMDAMILGDFGRADVQAFVLYRLMSPGSDYEYAWGGTYLGALSLLIPHSLWPDRPATSVKAGTEVQHYMGAYEPKVMESSKVYGLAGEAMLNFGPIVVPFVFVVFGLCVGFSQWLMRSFESLDSRYLLFPFLVNFCFVVVISDSDNLVWFLVKQGLVPALVIFFSSARLMRRGVSCK